MHTIVSQLIAEVDCHKKNFRRTFNYRLDIRKLTFNNRIVDCCVNCTTVRASSRVIWRHLETETAYACYAMSLVLLTYFGEKAKSWQKYCWPSMNSVNSVKLLFIATWISKRVYFNSLIDFVSLPQRWIQEPSVVRERDGNPQEDPLAVHCLAVCSESALLGDLFGVCRSRECDLLSVLLIHLRIFLRVLILYRLLVFLFCVIVFCYMFMCVSCFG